MTRLCAILTAFAALIALAAPLHADVPAPSTAASPSPPATTTAPAPKTANVNLKPLADRQDRLAGNVSLIQKQLPPRSDLKDISTNLHSAAGDMTDATNALYHNQKPDALPAQASALTNLDAAIAELQARLRRTHGEIDGYQLADLIREYETMKTIQQEINTQTAALTPGAAPNAPAPVRPELQFGTLARRQAGLVEEITSLNTDLAPAGVPVLLLMNTQVIQHMSISTRGLSHAETDPVLARAQEHALARLDDIITALKDEADRRTPFRHEDPNPRDPINVPRRPEPTPPPPLVPNLAQLKLLKALQLALNADTADAQKRTDSPATTEVERDALFGELQDLSRQQESIRDLATHFTPPPAPPRTP